MIRKYVLEPVGILCFSFLIVFLFILLFFLLLVDETLYRLGKFNSNLGQGEDKCVGCTKHTRD